MITKSHSVPKITLDNILQVGSCLIRGSFARMLSPARKLHLPAASFNSLCFLFVSLIIHFEKRGELSYSDWLLGKCRRFCVVGAWEALWHKFIP